jgi:hypothetical protein
MQAVVDNHCKFARGLFRCTDWPNSILRGVSTVKWNSVQVPKTVDAKKWFPDLVVSEVFMVLTSLFFIEC